MKGAAYTMNRVGQLLPIYAAIAAGAAAVFFIVFELMAINKVASSSAAWSTFGPWLSGSTWALATAFLLRHLWTDYQLRRHRRMEARYFMRSYSVGATFYAGVSLLLAGRGPLLTVVAFVIMLVVGALSVFGIFVKKRRSEEMSRVVHDD